MTTPTAVTKVTNASVATGGPAAVRDGVRAEAVDSKPRFRLDQRYIAPLLVTCILLVANFTEGVLESPWKTILAIATAMAVEMIAGRLMTGKWPHLASAYVTGISVGILIRSPEYWPYAVCAAISILSKYVLRVDGRHLWNPSNMGIVWMLLLAPQTVASLSIQWGNSVAPMVVIWLLGAFIISRIKRFHICATYVVSFVLFAALRHFLVGDPLASEISPLTGPMYQLFIFFMITDPKTTVKGWRAQVLVIFLVALVECLLRLDHLVNAPFYALFIVGPIANFIEIWRNKLHPPVRTAPVAA